MAMPFDLASVRSALPGRRIEWFPRIDSTMRVAAQLARDGCPSGTIVGATEQTLGVGRHGHTWHSAPGAGLYVSLVLRWPLPSETLPLVMLSLGIAGHRAIAQTAGLRPDLRWPNDVLLNGKKCAGVLARFENEAVIAGIGINVTHESFPAEIAELATSIRLAGASVRHEDVLVALARAVDDLGGALMERGSGRILSEFARLSSFANGRRVCVDQDGVSLEGTTCGLDASGFLRLRQDNGTVHTILAGGVRPI